MPRMSSLDRSGPEADPAVRNALPPKPRPPKVHHAHAHLDGYLGRRVRITHPPTRDKVGITLTNKSGVVVKALKKQYEVVLDDRRHVVIKREFLELVKDGVKVVPLHLHLKAEGLKVFDL